MDIDFRSVYASILHHWFDVETTEISNILYEDFEILPILKSTLDANDIENTNKDLYIFPVYPNPVRNSAKIQFSSKQGHVSLKLYSLSGQVVKTLVNRKVESGQHAISFNRDGLVNGQYLLVLQNGSIKDSQMISVQ